jgi:LacI family transcriptional regulator
LLNFTITNPTYCPKFKKNRKTKPLVLSSLKSCHFFSTVINGIEQVANENGYSVIIYSSDDSSTKKYLNLEMLANGSIDGFIMSLRETQLKGDFTI